MTINCKGELVDLKTPKVMGILNLTPDSFFDGGKYKDEASILDQVEYMGNIHSIIDILFSDSDGSVPFSYNPSVEGALEAEHPVSFTLNQNYPNPFNPITTIEFTLEKNYHIRLNIYNINGRKVKTLLSGFTLSGSYSIKWDGQDQPAPQELAF